MLLVELWFKAFLVTLAVEQLIAGWVLRRDVPWLRRCALIGVANVATHPAVWFIFPELGAGLGWSRLVLLGVSEGWAFGAEAAIYLLFLGARHRRRAALASALANGVSLGVGLGLREFGRL